MGVSIVVTLSVTLNWIYQTNCKVLYTCGRDGRDFDDYTLTITSLNFSSERTSLLRERLRRNVSSLLTLVGGTRFYSGGTRRHRRMCEMLREFSSTLVVKRVFPYYV